MDLNISASYDPENETACEPILLVVDRCSLINSSAWIWLPHYVNPKSVVKLPNGTVILPSTRWSVSVVVEIRHTTAEAGSALSTMKRPVGANVYDDTLDYSNHLFSVFPGGVISESSTLQPVVTGRIVVHNSTLRVATRTDTSPWMMQGSAVSWIGRLPMASMSIGFDLNNVSIVVEANSTVSVALDGRTLLQHAAKSYVAAVPAARRIHGLTFTVVDHSTVSASANPWKTVANVMSVTAESLSRMDVVIVGGSFVSAQSTMDARCVGVVSGNTTDVTIHVSEASRVTVNASNAASSTACALCLGHPGSLESERPWIMNRFSNMGFQAIALRVSDGSAVTAYGYSVASMTILYVHASLRQILLLNVSFTVEAGSRVVGEAPMPSTGGVFLASIVTGPPGQTAFAATARHILIVLDDGSWIGHPVAAFKSVAMSMILGDTTLSDAFIVAADVALILRRRSTLWCASAPASGQTYATYCLSVFAAGGELTADLRSLAIAIAGGAMAAASSSGSTTDDSAAGLPLLFGSVYVRAQSSGNVSVSDVTLTMRDSLTTVTSSYLSPMFVFSLAFVAAKTISRSPSRVTVSHFSSTARGPNCSAVAEGNLNYNSRSTIMSLVVFARGSQSHLFVSVQDVYLAASDAASIVAQGSWSNALSIFVSVTQRQASLAFTLQRATLLATARASLTVLGGTFAHGASVGVQTPNEGVVDFNVTNVNATTYDEASVSATVTSTVGLAFAVTVASYADSSACHMLTMRLIGVRLAIGQRAKVTSNFWAATIGTWASFRNAFVSLRDVAILTRSGGIVNATSTGAPFGAAACYVWTTTNANGGGGSGGMMHWELDGVSSTVSNASLLVATSRGRLCAASLAGIEVLGSLPPSNFTQTVVSARRVALAASLGSLVSMSGRNLGGDVLTAGVTEAENMTLSLSAASRVNCTAAYSTTLAVLSLIVFPAAPPSSPSRNNVSAVTIQLLSADVGVTHATSGSTIFTTLVASVSFQRALPSQPQPLVSELGIALCGATAAVTNTRGECALLSSTGNNASNTASALMLPPRASDLATRNPVVSWLVLNSSLIGGSGACNCTQLDPSWQLLVPDRAQLFASSAVGWAFRNALLQCLLPTRLPSTTDVVPVAAHNVSAGSATTGPSTMLPDWMTVVSSSDLQARPLPSHALPLVGTGTPPDDPSAAVVIGATCPSLLTPLAVAALLDDVILFSIEPTQTATTTTTPAPQQATTDGTSTGLRDTSTVSAAPITASPLVSSSVLATVVATEPATPVSVATVADESTGTSTSGTDLNVTDVNGTSAATVTAVNGSIPPTATAVQERPSAEWLNVLATSAAISITVASSGQAVAAAVLSPFRANKGTSASRLAGLFSCAYKSEPDVSWELYIWSQDGWKWALVSTTLVQAALLLGAYSAAYLKDTPAALRGGLRSLYAVSVVYYSPNIVALGTAVMSGCLSSTNEGVGEGGCAMKPVLGAIAVLFQVGLIGIVTVSLARHHVAASSSGSPTGPTVTASRRALSLIHTSCLDGISDMCCWPRRMYPSVDLWCALLAACVTSVPYASLGSCTAAAWCLVVARLAQLTYLIAVKPFSALLDKASAIALVSADAGLAVCCAVSVMLASRGEYIDAARTMDAALWTVSTVFMLDLLVTGVYTIWERCLRKQPEQATTSSSLLLLTQPSLPGPRRMSRESSVERGEPGEELLPMPTRANPLLQPHSSAALL